MSARTLFPFWSTLILLAANMPSPAPASPMSPPKTLQCKNLSLQYRPLRSSYEINDKYLVVKNGLGGGKYPLDGTPIKIKQPNGVSYTVRIRSDYQDVVIFATANIVGQGPFTLSRTQCPSNLPDAIELFLK